jgi:uncharacterized protein (TIGR03118 family)
MDFSAGFRKNRGAPGRPLQSRPVLECLEDRYLLSQGFGEVNLASDVPGLARVLNPDLVNPWGIAFSPTGPFWFAENGGGIASILDGSGQTFAPTVPVASATHWNNSPTGAVFNGGSGFVISDNGLSAPSRFLFVSQNGTIAGWSAVVDPGRALLVLDNSAWGADYTGLALAVAPTGQSFLYVADFSHGTIDVFDQAFRPVTRPGAFRDPGLPAGFAPFNVQNIGNFLFVTYAQQGPDWREDVPGAGHGFIDVYDPAGNLVRRFASQGALNSPWGLALAPADFGPFAGALLVGNNGDGHVNAYDPRSGAFLGRLTDDRGVSIVIPDLWSLAFGNGHAAGDAGTLFFTAGVGNESHGLFGAIQAPLRRGADTAGPGAFDPHDPSEPGDYPLPPRSGPAFRADGADRAIAIAELLPLRESSLVLVPTLSTVSRPDGGTKPADSVSVLSRTLLASGESGYSQPAETAPGDVVGLHAFLNVSGWQGDSATVELQQPERLPLPAFAAGLPAKNLDARPEAPASSGQGGDALTAASWETPVRPADESTAVGNAKEAEHRGVWTRLINGLLLLSIPVLWSFWPIALARPRRDGLEHG